MAANKLRVILLTHGGAEDVLTQLCSLDCVEVVGVFVENARKPPRTFAQRIKRSIRYDGYLITVGKLLRTVSRTQEPAASQSKPNDLEVLKCIAEQNHIPYYSLDDYHAPESIELLSSFNPDLGVGFGTNILKQSVFGIPKLGTINFHNGLVPYYRGGPPIFWELFNGDSKLGLTVHWMAAQVDAGDIILQETVPLQYDFSFDLDFESFINDYRAKLTGKFAQFMAKAVVAIAKGEAQRIAQDPTLGKRYRLPIKREKNELRRRLKKRRRLSKIAHKPAKATE